MEDWSGWVWVVAVMGGWMLINEYFIEPRKKRKDNLENKHYEITDAIERISQQLETLRSDLNRTQTHTRWLLDPETHKLDIEEFRASNRRMHQVFYDGEPHVGRRKKREKETKD